MMKDYDGIIFDVDGTLWDSTPVVKDAWNQAIKDFGIDGVETTADQLKGLFGLPMDDIIEKILPGVSLETRMEFKPKCFEYEHKFLEEKSGVLYPNLTETFEALKKMGKRLFIVSNCQAGYIELFIKKAGFENLVEDHLCPGDTDLLKADNIKIIVERNNLKNPIYVGDTQMDANACKEANVPIIFASYGFGDVKEPDFVIEKPMDLIDLFND